MDNLYCRIENDEVTIHDLENPITLKDIIYNYDWIFREGDVLELSNPDYMYDLIYVYVDNYPTYVVRHITFSNKDYENMADIWEPYLKITLRNVEDDLKKLEMLALEKAMENTMLF